MPSNSEGGRVSAPPAPNWLRREIAMWPPSGLANDDHIDNLARSIWLALLDSGDIEIRFDEVGTGHHRVLVLPLAGLDTDTPHA